MMRLGLGLGMTIGTQVLGEDTSLWVGAFQVVGEDLTVQDLDWPYTFSLVGDDLICDYVGDEPNMVINEQGNLILTT